MEFLRRPLILQWNPWKKIAVTRLKYRWKNGVSLKAQDDAQFKIWSKRPVFVLNTMKFILNLVVGRIYPQQFEYETEHTGFPDDFNFSENGSWGHPAFPYAHIQLDQATELILSHFWEEENSFIYDTLNNKNTQLVCIYFVYRPKKNASRTDLTNDDQKSNAFAPTYRDGSTAFHRHMISVVVFFLLK